MKKFKTSKKNKNKYIIIILFIILIYFIIYKYDIANNSVKYILNYVFNIKYDNKKDEVVFKEDVNPTIFIYNTHQNEEYKSNILDIYNIKSDVMLAGKILKEELLNYNKYSLVCTDDFIKYRNNLKLKYGKSYYVSRIFMEEYKNKYPTLEYFIDIHRDAGEHDATSLLYQGKYYAKVLFVVGLDNKNYQPNLDLASNLCDRFNTKISNICRGVVKKSGIKVNGIYNQDFSTKTMLIELGGENNKIEEVNRTIKILSSVLSDYINEENNEEKI